MDARAIKEKATQFFTKGKFAKAAEAFEEYCKADVRDVQARLRMGDAWAKAGKKDKAVLAYTSAAEGFAKEGFLPRAIACSKLILELDPTHQGVQKMLADLYARKSGSGRAAASPKPLSVPTPVAEPAVEVPPPAMSAGSGVVTAPSFANRADAIEIEIENDAAPPPAPAGAAEAPMPMPEPIEVPAWELPPPPPIEIELETTPSASAGHELEIELTSEDADQPIISGEVEVEFIDPEPSAPRPSAPEASFELDTPPPAIVSTTVMTPESVEVSIEVKPQTPKSSPEDSVGPPGLKPRKTAALPEVIPSSSQPVWAASTDVAGSRPSSVTTELERSLEAFSQFDVDAPAAAQPAPVPSAEPSFTELELEGDSFLQAVEAAAGKPYSSSPSISVSTEEAMEAVEEPKLEPGSLPKIPLFSDLPPDAFIALFEQCPLRRAEPGDVLIEQGSQGDSFFVICSGTAKVFRRDDGQRRELATLEEGAFFGEMALLSDAPRSASVEAAAEDTQLLEISAAVLTDLSRKHPTIASALKKFCRQRLLSNLMNGATLFRPFTKSERRDLVQKFRARDVNRGETLIREGERSDGLYVILTGEVGVAVQGQSVATLKEGDVFGEMSLLTRTAATATVMTSKKTSLLRLPREDFDAIIMSHPQILEQVAELTDARTRKNAELLKSKANAQSVI